MAAAAQRSSDVKYSQQNNLKFESREQYRSKTVKQSDLDSHRLFVIMEEQGHLLQKIRFACGRVNVRLDGPRESSLKQGWCD